MLLYFLDTNASPTGKFVIKPNTSKYLEILITITLYFIRSHYLPSSNVSPEFLEGNVKTQVSSLECLSNLTWELVKLVRESGHGFGNFITDLLSRCRVQKAIIHCLAATVNETRETPISSRSSSDTLQSSSDSLRSSSDSVRAQSRKTSNQSPSLSDRSRSSSESLPESSRRSSEETVDQMILQSKLLEVVESLIVLEHALLSCIEALTPDHLGNSEFEIIMKGGEDGVGGPNVEGYTSRFIQGKSLSSQEMLLNMVLCCLKAQGNFEISNRWTGFVIECLPYLGMDLKKWVVPVVLQMCSNISDVTRLFKKFRNGQEKW